MFSARPKKAALRRGPRCQLSASSLASADAVASVAREQPRAELMTGHAAGHTVRRRRETTCRPARREDAHDSFLSRWAAPYSGVPTVRARAPDASDGLTGPACSLPWPFEHLPTSMVRSRCCQWTQFRSQEIPRHRLGHSSGLSLLTLPLYTYETEEVNRMCRSLDLDSD